MRRFIMRHLRGDAPSFCLLPLSIFGWLYGVAMTLRRLFYRRHGFKRNTTDHRFPLVISIGNITTGGTGKTPLTMLIAKHLHEHYNLRIAVIVRGYRRQAQGNRTVTLDKNSLSDPDIVKIAGDEAVLLAQKLPFATIFSCPKRKQVIDHHSKNFDVFILDDAFQHLACPRHFDFVVIDNQFPFANGNCLPAGLLREPLSALKDADYFFVTHIRDNIPLHPHIKKYLYKSRSSAPILRCNHQLESLVRLADKKSFAPEILKKKRILAFCGIGNPDQFSATLLTYSPIAITLIPFPDHHAFLEKDLEKIKHAIAKHDMIVTTEKDAVRLGDDFMRICDEMYVTKLNVVLPQPDFEMLTSILSQLANFCFYGKNNAHTVIQNKESLRP